MHHKMKISHKIDKNQNYILVVFIILLYKAIETAVTFVLQHYNQGRTGHITRWERSHGAPLIWGPLRQSGAPKHHDLFFFCLGSGNGTL
jgi:hypothetical protein